MMNRLVLLAVVVVPIGCTSARDRARADSAQALVATQRQLMDKLVAQKDSVSLILGDANSFIGQIDQSISRVKGLPRASLVSRESESALQDQIRARKDMLRRVNALVERAQQTARELEAARARQAELMAENVKLRDSIGVDLKVLNEMQADLQRQAQTIAALTARVEGLERELSAARAAYSRGYYVVGTEDELLKKGVVVREGGANLLLAHIGRTLQPARDLKPELFTAIDTREVRAIPVPDATKRYQIVSRQSLDDAEVEQRDGAVFRGKLAIANVDKFWAPSRYLIIVQR